jgi:hypothetical protein
VVPHHGSLRNVTATGCTQVVTLASTKVILENVSPGNCTRTVTDQ